jgi:periplasmic divalent cation tolerance protein
VTERPPHDTEGAAQRDENDALVVLVTVATPEEGERLAAALVDERCAACVNIVGPIRSIYRWEGSVHNDQEFLLIIKTCTSRFAALEQRVRALHSYQTPEVVALPITAGSAPYLDWWRAQTVAPPEGT